MTLKLILQLSVLITIVQMFFSEWLYKINTPEFNRVNRSQYGRSADYKQDIFDCVVKNWYIPTSGNCFVKYINHLTVKEFTEDFLTFIRTEQRRSNVMTTAICLDNRKFVHTGIFEDFYLLLQINSSQSDRKSEIYFEQKK